ncbi:MAG TPA: hypothetical protein VHM48_03220 [Candidatus Limnocylindrales bacterium]|nr:hypothetical protein [Candidatus Limnocylindrales bacterium]
MSEQPESGSDSASTSETGASWSANGTQHEDAIAVAPETEVADVDPTAEPAATSTSSDDAATFLSELVRAMQTTVGAERARIATETDRRREEHLAAIQTRRESEAEKMRGLAADDLKAIDAWAEDERQRIQLEHERRAAALGEDLQKSLAEHGAKVDREGEGVEAAIATYRVDVDAFFGALDRETDPVAIAQHASQRPVFPTLDQAGEADATPATSVGDAPSTDQDNDAPEPTGVGVMDPDSGSRLAASFAAWNASGSAAPLELSADVSADGSTDAGSAADVAESGVLVAVAQGANDDGSESILHAVPSGRPLSWLRRDRDSSDRADEER